MPVDTRFSFHIVVVPAENRWYENAEGELFKAITDIYNHHRRVALDVRHLGALAFKGRITRRAAGLLFCLSELTEQRDYHSLPFWGPALLQ